MAQSDTKFRSAGLKLERAYKHIKDLDLEMVEMLRTYGHRPIVHGDRNDKGEWETHVTVEVSGAIPDTISVVIGDALHNLRCALDHAYWDFVGLIGETPDRHTKFPFGNTRQSYEASCKGIIKTRPDAQALLISIAAYIGGNGHSLAALNALNNRDKHSSFAPVVGVASVRNLVAFDMLTKKRVVLPAVKTKPGAAPGDRVLWLPPGVGLDCNQHIYTNTEIMFGDVEPVKFQSVGTTIRQMATAVEDALVKLMRFTGAI